MKSIYSEYYSQQSLIDRFSREPGSGIDVIIPVIHTNELWRTNLFSIYREIPVARLLIADGGCIDDSLNIAGEFPRVTVYDHRACRTLGFSLRKLIEEVKTEWFVYLHSDVYLPPGWFDAMAAHREEFDWFECPQHLTFLVDYRLADDPTRALSGSQMGRRAAFTPVLPHIEDDFLYRTEDIIIEKLVSRAGGRYGKATDTFHYHQVMRKPSPFERVVTEIPYKTATSREEEVRASTMRAHSIVKYLSPEEIPQGEDYGLVTSMKHLEGLHAIVPKDFLAWAHSVNPRWDSHLRKAFPQPTPVDVLLLIEGHAQAEFLTPLASLLVQQGSLTAVFGGNGFFGQYERDVRRTLAVTPNCFDQFGQSLRWITAEPRAPEVSPPALSEANAGAAKLMLTALSGNLPAELLTPLYGSLQSRLLDLQSAYELIERFRPKVVIAAEDSALSGTSAFVKAANESRIPVLLLSPEALWNTAFNRRPPGAADEAWAPFMRAAFPGWAKTIEGRTFLRLPPWDIVALETLGIAPARPWEWNAGGAHAKPELYRVATDSQLIARQLLSSGLTEQQIMLLTPSPETTFSQHAAAAVRRLMNGETR